MEIINAVLHNPAILVGIALISLYLGNHWPLIVGIVLVVVGAIVR